MFYLNRIGSPSWWLNVCCYVNPYYSTNLCINTIICLKCAYFHLKVWRQLTGKMVKQPLTEVIHLQYWVQGKVLMNWNSNKENIWLFIGLRQSISSECNVSPKPMWSECRNPRFTACQGDTAAYLTLGIGKASFSAERLSKAESFQCFFHSTQNQVEKIWMWCDKKISVKGLFS